MMPLVPCTICRHACVPLADYDQPVCIRCDNDMDRVVTRARTGVAQPRGELEPCGTHAAYNRHKARHEPLDDACIRGERAYQAARGRRVRAAARAAA